jgi:hypothetical protein
MQMARPRDISSSLVFVRTSLARDAQRPTIELSLIRCGLISNL